jgi:hypothetical protein
MVDECGALWNDNCQGKAKMILEKPSGVMFPTVKQI